MQAYQEYFATHMDQYLSCLWQHIYLSAIAIVIASVIGILFGILCVKLPRINKITETVFGVLRIIPSLVVLVILIPILGVGVKPTLVALVVLGLPQVLIQTVLGFAKVPDFMIEVAAAMGMNEKEIFRKVKLPLALPYIIAGIKMATAEIIASATLAAYIGAGGLGLIIFNGINLIRTELLVIGGLSVAALTLIATIILGRIEKRLYHGAQY